MTSSTYTTGTTVLDPAPTRQAPCGDEDEWASILELDVLAGRAAALRSQISTDATAADDASLAALCAAQREAERQVAAIRMPLIRQILDRSTPDRGDEGMARSAGFARPAQLVAELFGSSSAEAVRLCRLAAATTAPISMSAGAVPPRYPIIASCLAEGSMGIECASVIVTELEKAEPRCGRQALAEAELALVRYAAPEGAYGADPHGDAGDPSSLGGYSVDEIRILARRFRDHLDADGAQPRDDERHRRRSLRITTAPGGMRRIDWLLEPASAALVEAGIAAIVGQNLRTVSGPRAAVDAHGEEHAALSDSGTALENNIDTDFNTAGESARDDASENAMAETRSLDQQRCDAAVQIFRHGATCRDTAGELPAFSVVIRIDESDLRAGIGSAEIDSQPETVSAGTVRKLAADAELIPEVLGGRSEVLDLGRGRRLFSRAQRLAFIERDGGCAWAGCGSPPAYAQAHHIEWWSHGGRSDLDNGVMLCSHHHHRVHDSGWQITMRDAVPYFIPPPVVDPRRRPRRGGKVEVRTGRSARAG